MRGGPGLGQHRAVAVRLLPGDEGPRPRRLSRAGPRAVVDRRGRRARAADAFEIAERYRTPVDDPRRRRHGPGDGAGRPGLPDARSASPATGQLTGADGRPPRVGPLAPPPPEDLEAHNRHLQAKFADDRRARGPLGGRAARRRGDRDRRLRDRGARRPDGDRAGARAGAARSVCSARSACGRSRPAELARPRSGCARIVVVEMSAGQMVEDVRLAVEEPPPGLLPRPDRRHGPDARRGRRCPAPQLGADRRPGATGSDARQPAATGRRRRHRPGESR